MKKLTLIILTVFVGSFLFLSVPARSAESFGIVATVNKDAISQADLSDRIKLILISAGLQNTKSNRARVQSQALDSLIEEQIKKQEAQKQNISVTPDDVTKGFEAIAAQNNLDADQFSSLLKRQGIPKSTILAQIEAQIAWTKVVKAVLRPRIDITETDIESKMDRIKGNIGKLEYNTSEIFLAVDDPEKENEVRQLAQKMVQEMKFDGTSFETMATQFSEAQSAENGGKIGWIQEGELSKELDLVLRNLSEGQISSPIRVPAGFHIIQVTQKRTATGETLPTEEDVLNSIGLERLDRLQQRYLADLKSVAFIDRRI